MTGAGSPRPAPVGVVMHTCLPTPQLRMTDVRRYHSHVSQTQLGDHLDALGQAFARGEADLKAVYDAHGALVHAICRKALGDDGAGEVTQDVFVSAWRARHQFDPARGALGAWLVGITKRRIIDHVRRAQRHSDRRADLSPEQVDTTTRSDSESSIERVADRMAIVRALKSLPTRSQEAIGLAYVHGLTHHEIAERTGQPLGTIKSDIRRGLLALRDQMESSHE
jgi:RNA polymerase sigma factor (sigma-70 family)